MKISIDNQLLLKAQKSSGINDNKALVEKALKLLLKIDNQKDLIKLLTIIN